MHTESQKVYYWIKEMCNFAVDLETELMSHFGVVDMKFLTAVQEQLIPRSGSFLYKCKDYHWKLHGSGISFIEEKEILNYLLAPIPDYGINFTEYNIGLYLNYISVPFKRELIEDGVSALVASGHLATVIPGHGVYKLTSTLEK